MVFVFVFFGMIASTSVSSAADLGGMLSTNTVLTANQSPYNLSSAVQVPKGIAGLMKTLGKERGEKYLKQSNEWLEEVCTLSRENLGSSKTRKVFGMENLFHRYRPLPA